MRRSFSVLISILIFLGNASCSVNILKTFADTTSNESLYVDAQNLVDTGNYDGALAKIALMTGSFASTERVLILKASAYGGLCGFNFLTFAQALPTIGATPLFHFLLQQFVNGSVTSMANCKLAQTTIESIGTVATRSDDQNLFMAMIAFAKIGNILSYYADADDDGTPDPAYNVCSPAGISDADAREIGTGFTIAFENLGALAGSVSLGGAQFSQIQGICTTIGATICAKTDPTDFTPTEVSGIRSLVIGTDLGLSLTAGGLGTCPGDLSNCICP